VIKLKFSFQKLTPKNIYIDFRNRSCNKLRLYENGIPSGVYITFWGAFIIGRNCGVGAAQGINLHWSVVCCRFMQLSWMGRVFPTLQVFHSTSFPNVMHRRSTTSTCMSVCDKGIWHSPEQLITLMSVR
jgi:hypothetical protein